MRNKTETSLTWSLRETLPAMRLVGTPSAARKLGFALGVMLILLPFVFLAVPWRQNIPCAGNVVAFTPLDRQQTLQAPVSGRVVECSVVEGSKVSKGDLLMVLEDQDPNYLFALQAQVEAARTKLRAAEDKANLYSEQIVTLERVRELAISAASSELEIAVAKVEAAVRSLEAAEAEREQKELDYQRQQRLFKKKLASELTAQMARSESLSANAKVEEAKAKVGGARSEEQAKNATVGKIGQDAKAKVDSTRALREAAQADVAVARQQLAEATIKVERQKTQVVIAPRDGRVYRIRAAVGAEVLKQGDPLLDLIPDTDDLAVELWVRGNDAPLIQEGRDVRLQFEGWPAVQFAGWPSVAVGTFGGRVALVDAQADPAGRFRILVRPDPRDEPWPQNRFLRQGGRANGWVLLDNVQLGYELWRQLNSFPPTVAMEPSSADATGEEKK